MHFPTHRLTFSERTSEDGIRGRYVSRRKLLKLDAQLHGRANNTNVHSNRFNAPIVPSLVGSCSHRLSTIHDSYKHDTASNQHQNRCANRCCNTIILFCLKQTSLACSECHITMAQTVSLLFPIPLPILHLLSYHLNANQTFRCFGQTKSCPHLVKPQVLGCMFKRAVILEHACIESIDISLL